MADMPQTAPAVKPVNPNFSSGPCAKRPGWTVEALSKAVERIRTAVLSQDHATFVALMRRGQDYLQDRKILNERRA